MVIRKGPPSYRTPQKQFLLPLNSRLNSTFVIFIDRLFYWRCVLWHDELTDYIILGYTLSLCLPVSECKIISHGLVISRKSWIILTKKYLCYPIPIIFFKKSFITTFAGSVQLSKLAGFAVRVIEKWLDAGH